MGKCVSHPDVETDLICLKYNEYYCEECASCRTPTLYCKFRKACSIWYAEYEDEDVDKSEDEL